MLKLTLILNTYAIYHFNKGLKDRHRLPVNQNPALDRVCFVGRKTSVDRYRMM